MYDIFLAVLKRKKPPNNKRFCRYMQGKKSILYESFYELD